MMMGIRSCLLWPLLLIALSNGMLQDLSPSTPISRVAILSRNQQLLADAPPFPRTWVPLASVFELDPDRPNRVQFLNNSYVTYRDNFGQWVVVDETCPHRLAPLSEGRINRDTNLLECSYHGWAFDAQGKCQQIPQANESELQVALRSPRCHVQAYSVQVVKQIIWAWLWPEDSLQFAQVKHVWPEHFVSNMEDNTTTYTRDLPYNWDTLLENIVDASHVPWAHHGLQGKRQDAIPLNMTMLGNITEDGLSFYFDDRTMSKRRHTSATFRAPFGINFAGEFEDETIRTFNLTTLMLPTRPGWSRIIIYGGKRQKDRSSKAKETLFAVLFRVLPIWLLHQFSNKFLDSDLAFLHHQEQARCVRGKAAYFVPTQGDRCVVAIRRWVNKFAHIPGPLPPLVTDRSILFDRLAQHSDQCRYCHGALDGIVIWRKRSYQVLALSILFIKSIWARLAAVGCLGVLRVLATLEASIRKGGFDHYKND